MTNRTNKWVINSLLSLSALTCSFSGLVIQIVYHMKNADSKISCIGFNHSTWATIHKASGLIFALLCAYHIYAHRRWYKTVIKNKNLRKKIRQVLIFSVIFILSTTTGLSSWVIDSLSQESQFRIPLIEIHDKISIGLIILITAHTAKRWRRFI